MLCLLRLFGFICIGILYHNILPDIPNRFTVDYDPLISLHLFVTITVR